MNSPAQSTDRNPRHSSHPAMEEEQSLARALIYRFIAATHRPGLQPRYLST